MNCKAMASGLVVILFAVGLSSAGDSAEQKKEKTRKNAAQILQDLYKLQPSARAAIQKSSGYAVFNNVGTNVRLLSTARGSGIAVNQQTQQETFMKMSFGDVVLGVAVNDYRVVFAFESDKAFS